MISKSQLSFVKSLHQKKNRKKEGLFIVEGIKSITEFIHANCIVSTIFSALQDGLKLDILSQNVAIVNITDEELKKISTLKTPQKLLAIVQIPDPPPIKPFEFPKDRFTLILDSIQDPGNLGTIIRTADWFGFQQLICSMDTADAYNPKVVQASMGSLAHVQIHYENLTMLLKNCELPIYGALLDGESIYEANILQVGILILGNEGNGISDRVRQYIKHPIAIPRYGQAESLNVAVAAGIFCMKMTQNFTDSMKA